MKKIYYFKKVLGLITLLICGVWTTQAQSVTITPGATSNWGNEYFYCMDVKNTGTNFTVTGSGFNFGTTTGYIDQYTWIANGGIDITGGQGNSTVTVKPKTDITYANGYNKYAKGKLSVTCRVKYTYTYIVVDPCEKLPDDTLTYTYYSNYTTQIEIRKEFSNLDSNQITGPICVSTGERVTYSVEPWVSSYQLNIVGVDAYEWTIPAGVAQGNVLYYSADKSSVTFNVGTDFAGKTISVRMGACNLIAGQTPITLTLKAKPGAPTLSGNVNLSAGLCIPLNTPQQSITISNTDSNATYIWGNLTGWLTNPTLDTVILTNNYTLDIYPKDDARVLWLKVISSCGTEQIYTLSVKRSFSINNKILTISGSKCVNPNTIVPFMVTGVDNSVGVTWTILDGTQSGWYIFPGTANSTQPFIFTGTGNATISVTTTGCTGLTITETFNINPKVPVINSANPICLSVIPTTQTFKIRQSDPNATSGYQWDYPSQWQFVSANSNQSSITLTMTTGGTIKVRAIGCDTTAWSDPIDIETPVPPQLTAFPPCISPGIQSSVRFSVIPVPNVTYNWIIPSNFGYITNSNSDSSFVDVTIYGNIGDFVISVRAVTNCGLSQWTTDTISITDPFWLDTEPIGTRYRYVYVETNDTTFDWDNSFYSWYVNGVFFESGYGHDLITLTPPNVASGRAYVIIATPDGCEYIVDEISWPTKGGNSSPDSGNSRFDKTVYSEIDEAFIIIAPNPAQNRVTVTLPEITNSPIVLFNIEGKLIKRIHSNSLNTEINISDISNGTYIISVEQNGKRYSKQLIINK